jgi:hypothetical protein
MGLLRGLRLPTKLQSHHPATGSQPHPNQPEHSQSDSDVAVRVAKTSTYKRETVARTGIISMLLQ